MVPLFPFDSHQSIRLVRYPRRGESSRRVLGTVTVARAVSVRVSNPQEPQVADAADTAEPRVANVADRR